MTSQVIFNPCQERGIFNLSAEAALQFEEQAFEQRKFEIARDPELAKKIGAAAIEGYEKRRYHELTTTIAEAMVGRVDTEYSFELLDGKFVAEDGEFIEDLVGRGFREAIKTASEDKSNFYAGFLPRRARYELDEVREDQAMARGETSYNTTAKFSPYTEELDTSSENREKLIAANQKPYWQRGMFRLKHWDEQDQRLYMVTLSIDNSSVRFLQDIAQEAFGYQYKAQDSTETVGETIRLNIKDGSWGDVPKRVTSIADQKLSIERGGTWVQGRSEEEAVDTQKFVESQTAILKHILDTDQRLTLQHSSFEVYEIAFQNHLYDQVALLEELRMGSSEVFTGNVEAASAAAGYIAREEGRVYDACGLILDGGNKAANLATQTGLESLLRLVGQELSCANPKCRKKVTVPKDDLEAGVLSCKECGLVYDVCTKKSRFDKSKIKSKQALDRQPDLVESISLQLARIDKQIAAKRQRDKEHQAQQDLAAAA